MTRHLIDPELVDALEILPPFRLADETLAGFREGLAAMIPSDDAVARDGVTIHRAMAPGSPSVPVVIYRPDSTAPLPALVYVHGGGYVLGRATDVGAAAVRTAAEVGCAVFSVDYRLAPETRAPGQVQDCYAVLEWIHAEATALDIDPSRIAVGGESAGGGLAAALAIMARDRGDIPICFQMLIYPMLDDRTVLSKPNPATGEFIWTRESNLYGWRSLLGVEPGSGGVGPYQAAARVEDVAGLPPAYLSVGALDLFLEEDVAYAARLLAAGIPTELHVWPGAFHGFEMATESRVAIRAEEERRSALARAFGTTVSRKSPEAPPSPSF